MQYNLLGKTGMNVSKVGFGGIPIQRCTQEEANQLINRAIELGLNFIDTSRIYNGSEDLIGNALAGKRDKMFIATKSMARDKEAFAKDVQLSLQSLKTDYIDLYQLHNIPSLADLEKVMSEGYALEHLVELKKQGVVRHIGITSHSLSVIEKALEYEVFETIQYPYSAVENQVEGIFAKAKEKNVGTIAMKPMAGGSLTDGRAALKYILNNPNLNCAIPGMEKLHELEQNASAADGTPLSEGELEELIKIAKSLGQTFCRRCGYCKPCPQGIDIPYTFIMEGYYSRYDLKEWAKTRYEAMPAKASDCLKCGACEPKCPYNLPIRDMLDRVRRVFEG